MAIHALWITMQLLFFLLRLLFGSIMAWFLTLVLRTRARVLRILYVQPEGGDILPVYHAPWWAMAGSLGSCLQGHARRLLSLPLERGYLLIYIWNPWAPPGKEAQTFCLNPYYLQVVFAISSPYSLWVLSDDSLVFCLHMLQIAMGYSVEIEGIRRVYLGQEDVTRELAPVLFSLSLKHNLCARVVPCLYQHLTGGKPAPEHAWVRLIHQDLSRTDCAGEDFLVP